MKNILENLWFNYIIEIPMKKTNKEKETISEWSKKEDCFYSMLDKEQISVFEDYDNALSQVNRITEKNAFLKGVIFATRFIIEALYDE